MELRHFVELASIVYHPSAPGLFQVSLPYLQSMLLQLPDGRFDSPLSAPNIENPDDNLLSELSRAITMSVSNELKVQSIMAHCKTVVVPISIPL